MLARAAVVIVCLVATTTIGIADDRCFVRAPTDPTAVRAHPDSTFAAASVPNGTQVSMWRVERHAGQRWAYVTLIGLDGAGYVPRDFLVCF